MDKLTITIDKAEAPAIVAALEDGLYGISYTQQNYPLSEEQHAESERNYDLLERLKSLISGK